MLHILTVKLLSSNRNDFLQYIWLVSSIGRALHRYRRGHGFKSRTGLNFFPVLFTTTRYSSVLSCEDLLISSLHRSANI